MIPNRLTNFSWQCVYCQYEITMNILVFFVVFVSDNSIAFLFCLKHLVFDPGMSIKKLWLYPVHQASLKERILFWIKILHLEIKIYFISVTHLATWRHNKLNTSYCYIWLDQIKVPITCNRPHRYRALSW